MSVIYPNDACNCDTGMRSGGQVHDRWCGRESHDARGFNGAGALVSEYESRQQLAAKETKVTEAAHVLREIKSYAEQAYHGGRARLDQIEGWVHGDDGPVYPFLRIAKAAEAAINSLAKNS